MGHVWGSVAGSVKDTGKGDNPVLESLLIVGRIGRDFGSVDGVAIRVQSRILYGKHTGLVYLVLTP